MKRGRVLQSYLGSSRESRQDSEQATVRPSEGGDNVAPQETTTRAPVFAARGRGGRILTQLASLSLESRQKQEPVHAGANEPAPMPEVLREPSPPASSSDSGRNGNGLSRRGSNASTSSILSQQFVKVEEKSRTILSKEPSTGGRVVELSHNYVTFDLKTETAVEEYHVDFNPNIESVRLRYQILRSEAAQQIIGNVMHWTGTNLYLPIQLPKKRIEFETKHPVVEHNVKVRITYIRTPPDSDLLPFYNSLMHKVMNRLKYVLINRSHYSPLHKIAIDQHKLEVWPGWVTTVQRLDGGIKLGVDSSFRVLRLETVRDIMMEIKERGRGNLKESIEQELIGAIIMTKYNNHPYRIDGIDLNKRPTDTFTLSSNDRQISYIDYLKEHWNVDVRDHHQPMIVHIPKPKRGQTESEPVYLIPELCVTTGLTDTMRANFNIMKSIGEHTRLPPQDREKKLREFLHQLATDDRAKSVLSDWNLAVKPEIEVVCGRRLDTETVLFGEGRSIKAPDNVDWTRPATTGPVFQSVDIENWVIMFTERDSNIAQDFMSSMRDVSRTLGIKFLAPRIVKLQNDSATSYVNAGKREVKITDQMVVILTPGKGQREDRYSACKRLYSCELSVPCQFIRSGTISNPAKLRSIVQKVVIQILSKCGGQPWAIKLPIKSFMIIGIDVYHDTLDRKRSCVGFVASMNEHTSRWWSQTFFQESLEEIGQKINLTMINALRRYHAVNGFVPQKIIVYRDGVGDGQMETVVQIEVVQVLNGIKFYMRDLFDNEPVPQVSYIIVQKRINAKLSLRQNDRVLNPLPGTYLDHSITHPEYNDFYLVSQHVNQGTVSPTKYVVISENGGFKIEHHQKLAYKMTYMYFNWCGTIRVPAPCQYAHKLAYLTGQNIKQQASEKLEDKLYYL